MMRRIFILLAIAIVLLPLNARADGVSFKTEKGNIYSAGGNVSITESSSGDIATAGGNVLITGEARDDVLAAGGTVHLTGRVGDDVRIAGGDVTIESAIGGEAVLAGGEIKLLPKTTVKNDLLAAGGKLSVEGSVGGSAWLSGGNVTINGTIMKDVDVKTGCLIIGKNAVINGNLRYTAPSEATIEPGAVIKGQKIFERKEYKLPHRKLLGLLLFLKLLAMETAALLLYFLMRKKMENLAALALGRFGRELLTGFIVLAAAGAAIGVLFISVAGLLFGLIGCFFYVAFILLSWVLGAVVFSGLLGRYVFRKEQYVTWPLILLGVFTYELLGLVPILGWLMKFAFFLSAFGALSQLVYLNFKKT